MRTLGYILALAAMLLIVGCTPIKSAPVVDGWNTAAGQDSEYIVQPGDTIYSIAWSFDVSYKDIAELNDLQAPYSLSGVRYLNMPAPSGASKFTASVTSTDLTAGQPATDKSPAASNPPARQAPTKWVWPLRGKIIAAFKSGNPPNKGVDISATYGAPVLAAAAGEVVYSGSGLQGYGNLIIIKHQHDVMTAYAYNSQLLVRLGS